MDNPNTKSLYIKRPYHAPDYRITTTDANLRKILLTQYGEYITETAAEFLEAYEIAITRDCENYKVTHNNIEALTPFPATEIEDIIHETTTFSDSILALHGAAAEYRGRAYPLLAPTTGGKTTLVSYLSENGFGYITDDCVILDRKNFHIIPYPRPVHLRRGGLNVLEKYGAAPGGITHLTDLAEERFFFNPANPLTETLPLGEIFFISRSETENAVVEMTANERITELMRSPMFAYEINGEYLKLVSALAKMKCRRLIYRDMDFVKETVICAGNSDG